MSRRSIAPLWALRRRSLAGASLQALLVAAPAVLIAGAAEAQSAGAAQAAAGAAAVDELVVTGQRLGQARAVIEQRQAVTVTSVVSADNLGKLPDANVADALARVPGVNVIVNQDTGEGEFVSVRGLAGTFNSYSINGVRVAQTDPDTRAVSLTVLPPNGLQAIRVAKTLTPDMDGDAIGGAVDFRTPTAFDFAKPMVRGFASWGFNDRAKTRDVPNDNTQLQLDFAQRFGSGGRFGIYGTGYWTQTHGANEETENDGEWEPFRWRKNDEEPIDARSLYLPGIDLDFRRNKQVRYGGNFSLDYRGDQHELYARAQYSRFERTSDNNWTDFRSRPSPKLTQVNPEDATLAQPNASILRTDPVKGRVYSYTTGQIVDQDGDGLITDADRNDDAYWSMIGRSGTWAPETFQFARTFDVNDQNQTLGTVNFGGESRFDRLTLDYDLSYSWGEKASPNNYTVGFNCDACSAPFDQTGLLWSNFDPRFPLPQLPAIAANAQSDDSLLPFDGASLGKNKQTDKRGAIKIDGRYEMDAGALKFFKAGGKVLRSERKYDSTPLWEGDLPGSTLASSGLVERRIDDFLGDRYYLGSIMSRDKVISAIDAASRTTPASFDQADYDSDDKQGRETIYAGYGLANFKFDELEVITGLRIEHTKVHNEFWIDDSKVENGQVVDNSRFGTTDRDYTVALPSVTATWRTDGRFVYRGAIWTSFSRPEFQAISGGQSISYSGAGSNRIITAISQGNPDLKPARSTNFDLSAEFYPDDTGVISVGFFYKDIRNFIFTLGNTAEVTESRGGVEITQPKNGEKARLYGVELNFIKQLVGLPAPFDGFGVEANLTLQDSSAETGLDYRKGQKIAFVGAPDLLYNAALTYQKFGFETKLSYNYQGKYIESLRANAVDKWVQPNKSLDFHSRYNIRPGFSIDFDVSNILDGWRYYTTRGPSPGYMKDYMEPGRTYLLKVVYTR